MLNNSQMSKISWKQFKQNLDGNSATNIGPVLSAGYHTKILKPSNFLSTTMIGPALATAAVGLVDVWEEWCWRTPPYQFCPSVCSLHERLVVWRRFLSNWCPVVLLVSASHQYRNNNINTPNYTDYNNIQSFCWTLYFMK